MSRHLESRYIDEVDKICSASGGMGGRGGWSGAQVQSLSSWLMAWSAARVDSRVGHACDTMMTFSKTCLSL
jgi:hypothetical protein